MFSPESLEIAVVSFEGPDQYSLVGGLGVRARELCRAFAGLRFRTTLVFLGDPSRPLTEVDHGVNLVRWGREVSAQYSASVYDGEDRRVAHLTSTLPEYIVTHVIAPAASRGHVVAVLCEEWQTAAFCNALSDLLYERGLRQHAVLVWNANNHFGFERIDWAALGYVSAITTVSRYMKHLMWPYGVNPVVIPNGIPRDSLQAVDPAAIGALRSAANTSFLSFKLGRFHPDKRWHQAITAVAQLRHDGIPARLLMRGGIESFGGAVLHHARGLGLGVADWYEAVNDVGDLVRALSETGGAAVINLYRFVPDTVLPTVYAAAAAVLANSGHEPFGLVGLETMAAGGVAVVGSTGEEYARPYGNAVVVESDAGLELAGALHGLVERPNLDRRLRSAGRRDAADYAWPLILEGLLERLRFFSLQQRVPVPAWQSTDLARGRMRTPAIAATSRPAGGC